MRYEDDVVSSLVVALLSLCTPVSHVGGGEWGVLVARRKVCRVRGAGGGCIKTEHLFFPLETYDICIGADLHSRSLCWFVSVAVSWSLFL